MSQKRPAYFSISAIVTTSDLEFDVSDIDFGHCTIYEAVTKSIRLTNYSMLPQEFGFVGLPEVDFSSLTYLFTCLIHRQSQVNQYIKHIRTLVDGTEITKMPQ